MQTFREFLIWYNNLDVQPFCEALEKMCAFWKDKKIDMLRQGISIPGVTLTYLFTTLESGIFFSLFDEKNKDLYYLFKKNMVGGPSIIFHRYHEAGKTKIREREITDQGKEPKMCQKIVGYDANALYLWAIMQNMPTGSFTRRREETNFKKESSTKMATEWLEWKAHEGGIFIRHQMNNTEKRIGERKIPVDGFHGPSQTVFQFHGCWWHGHICHLTKGKEMNEKRKRPMAELREETKETSKYIKDQGYHLVEIYECQWRRIKKTNSQVQQFLNSKFNRPLDHHKTLTQDQILSAIRSESLFGVVECDVRVPDALKPKFAEMCPIFKNIEISREDIGQHMQTFAEEENIMSQPRRSLVGSYFGEKILLASPLIKWYLEHGLEVTHIYQVVEYTPVPCFQPFGEAVSDARRAGDVDPNKAIIADTMKLVSCSPIEGKEEEIRYKVQKNSYQCCLFFSLQVGNSSYGKTITDQERHREVQFCEETKASRLINKPFFRQIELIDKNTFEVQSCKKKIKLNLPMQIGFFVYQYAKLRMLQFYFDFMDKYLDRSNFKYCEMDTDTPEHKACDKRTPVIFKEEWSGAGIIGLSSKTYCCFGAYDKFSCKGVNKEKYLNVRLTKQSCAGLNKGFRVVNNSMYTYEQVRYGFSYFYPKRKVLEDKVTTMPLYIQNCVLNGFLYSNQSRPMANTWIK